MSTASKPTYQKKTVIFAGTEITLYSIDGVTWSTRPQELHDIQERHENERSRISEFNRGRMPVKGAKGAPAAGKGRPAADAVADPEMDAVEMIDDDEEPRAEKSPAPVAKGPAPVAKGKAKEQTARGGAKGAVAVVSKAPGKVKAAPAKVVTKGAQPKAAAAKEPAAAAKKAPAKTVALKQPQNPAKKDKVVTKPGPLTGKARAAGGKRR